MKCIWRKWNEQAEICSHGHGLRILDMQRSPEKEMIAFVDGFDWFHGLSRQATVYVIEPDETTPGAVIDDMKSRLQDAMKPKSFPPELTPRLKIHANA